MEKIRIIPPSKIDKINAFLTPLSLSVGIICLITGEYYWSIFFVIMSVASGLSAYVFQDQPKATPESKKYSEVIDNISIIGNQLYELSRFLEQERNRISDTEATITKLNNEKMRLEPLIQTDKQIVDAILMAHAERTSRSAWKERILGFTLGIAASLVASFTFEYITRK